MSKKEIDPKYSPEGLPPVKNYFLYTYRCLIKMFAFAFFGIGSVFVAIVIFIMRIFIHPKKTFKKAARSFTSLTFRGFINMLRVLGCLSLKVDDRKKYKSLKSKIIIANHPSILDVVFIISLVPNTDCIVRGGLAKTILAGVIRQIYMVNTLGYEEMVQLSKEALDSGSNLIVFPEGTRTPRHGTNPYKRGAARIALETGYDVQPIYIGGTDKYGLGKHDRWFSYNPTEKYVYDMHILDEIKIDAYKDMDAAIAARHLTDDMHEKIASAAMSIDGRTV